MSAPIVTDKRQAFAEQAARAGKGILRDHVSGEPLVPLPRPSQPASNEPRGVLREEPEHPGPALDENRAFALETWALLDVGPLAAGAAVESVRGLEASERAVHAAYRAVLADDGKAAKAGGSYHVGQVGALAVVERAAQKVLDAVDAIATDYTGAVARVNADPLLSDRGKAEKIAEVDALFGDRVKEALGGFGDALEVSGRRRDALVTELEREHRAPKERDRTERLLEEGFGEQDLAIDLTLSGAAKNHEAPLALLDRYVAAGDVPKARRLLRHLAVAAPDSLRVKAAALRLRHQAERLRSRALLDDPKALRVAAELSLIEKVERGIENVRGLLKKHGPAEVKLARTTLARLFEDL